MIRLDGGRKMAKRKTLPKEFDELLQSGDIDALKNIFKKCEINAVTSRYGSNAFEKGPLPKEFAYWLKEQGCDINQVDYYGNTPIFAHASAYYGDVALLLELGADGNAIGRDKQTPLHKAAMYGRIDALNALLKHGVNVSAQAIDIITKATLTPLEITLQQNRLPKDVLFTICESLLHALAEVSELAKEYLVKIGKDYEYNKARFANSIDAKEQFALQDVGMQNLYKLFSIPPVEPVFLDIHDGISKIIVKETNTKKAYKYLWDYLVPPSGIAKTAQGEVIRIVGKVCREILHNGGMNWDDDYKNMLTILPQYFQQGIPLSTQDIEQVHKIIKVIYDGNCDEICDDLTPYCVAWVTQNEEVLPLIPPTYKR